MSAVMPMYTVLGTRSHSIQPDDKVIAELALRIVRDAIFNHLKPPAMRRRTLGEPRLREIGVLQPAVPLLVLLGAKLAPAQRLGLVSQGEVGDFEDRYG